MAHYHLSVKGGGKAGAIRGSSRDGGTAKKPRAAAAKHAQYIAREASYTPEKYGAVRLAEAGNMPAWAKGATSSEVKDAIRFFEKADGLERANGNVYREFECALQRELTAEEQVASVREAVREFVGEQHPYLWAIHDSDTNPHVHIMFSDRMNDGIERATPEDYFKRANSKDPAKGGAKKSDRFHGTAAERADVVRKIRERFAEIQNAHLTAANVKARVDHRSLRDQGVDRLPQEHQGPAISGIDKRHREGKEPASEVSVRRSEQRRLRQEAHQGLIGQLRELERHERLVRLAAARKRRRLLEDLSSAEREEEAAFHLVEQIICDDSWRVGAIVKRAIRRVERRVAKAVSAVDQLVLQAMKVVKYFFAMTQPEVTDIQRVNGIEADLARRQQRRKAAGMTWKKSAKRLAWERRNQKIGEMLHRMRPNYAAEEARKRNEQSQSVVQQPNPGDVAKNSAQLEEALSAPTPPPASKTVTGSRESESFKDLPRQTPMEAAQAIPPANSRRRADSESLSLQTPSIRTLEMIAEGMFERRYPEARFDKENRRAYLVMPGLGGSEGETLLLDVDGTPMLYRTVSRAWSDVQRLNDLAEKWQRGERDHERMPRESDHRGGFGDVDDGRGGGGRGDL